MTSPMSGLPQTSIRRRFPRTREEAQVVTNDIEEAARRAGCRCKHLKVEFVTPRAKREKPYVYVEHEPLCLLAYGGSSS